MTLGGAGGPGGARGVAYSDPVPEQILRAHLSQLTLSIKLSGADQLFSARAMYNLGRKGALS